METAEKKNKKLDARLEKRKKWLEEKKGVSRVTRARVAQQHNGSTSSSPSSDTSSGIHKISPKQDTKIASSDNKWTKDRQQKNKSVQNQKTKSKVKEPDVKTISAKTPIKVPPKSKYNNVKPAEKNTYTSEPVIKEELQEKVKPKKLKNHYVDPVEKLVNSTSVHIPKRYVVLVKNLPSDITRDQVDEHFRKTGGVKSIRIPRDRGTDNAKGYAYVEFNSTISHRIALRLHNTTLAGRKITVEFTPNDKKVDKKEDKSNGDTYLDMSKLNMPFDT